MVHMEIAPIDMGKVFTDLISQHFPNFFRSYECSCASGFLKTGNGPLDGACEGEGSIQVQDGPTWTLVGLVY